MNKTVTIAMPVYKRLQWLPAVLHSASLQDYANIELLVSDNGQNGTRLRELVERHYKKPFRFRQNATTVTAAAHFNQLIHEAGGEYFVMLCDDDDISANYVSEMVKTLEQHPNAAVAVSKQEIIDGESRVLRKSSDVLPDELTGTEFVRAWTQGEYKFECWVTNLARTDDLRRAGGYPDLPMGTHCDDTLILKLCLGRSVAFNSACTFRYRVEESSLGWSMSCNQIAEDTRQFLRLLDTDAVLREYARQHPKEWRQARSHLVRMTWDTYYWRWKTMYRERMTRSAWFRAAFDLPFIPAYYAKAAPLLCKAAPTVVREQFRERMPWAYRLYRKLKDCRQSSSP